MPPDLEFELLVFDAALSLQVEQDRYALLKQRVQGVDVVGQIGWTYHEVCLRESRSITRPIEGARSVPASAN